MIVDATQHGYRTRFHADIERREMQTPDVFGARLQPATTFDADERDGRRGAHGNALHFARIGTKTGRHIERKHGACRDVDRTDHRRERRTHRLAQTDTEHGIDDHVAAGERDRRRIAPRLDPQITGEHGAIGQRRIALQCRGIRGREHAHRKTRRVQQDREHVAIAAVVARAAHDGVLACQRPLGARDLQSRSRGALHQHVARRSRRNHCGIAGTHLRGGVRVDRQHRASILVTP